MAVRVPPCKLYRPKRNHMFQTYFTKVAGAEDTLLTLHGQSRIFDRRCLASATVAVPMGPEAGSYLVQTFEKECEDTSFAARMQVELGKLPGQPTAEWTRPLNRRLQRLFGWGDVAATSDDLRHAARTGNVEQLQALMPQAACLIRGNKVEFEHLPARLAAASNRAYAILRH